MVLNKYTSKETKDFNKCFNDILDYISKLKIDESKKREKNKIDKINEQINNCKHIIDSKKIEKTKKIKLNHYNIYTMDYNNFENNKPHLNILTDNIRNILIEHEVKDKLLNKCAKIWNNLDDKTIKEYKKLTKNKIFTKEDYYEIIENNMKSTPKQKKK